MQHASNGLMLLCCQITWSFYNVIILESFQSSSLRADIHIYRLFSISLRLSKQTRQSSSSQEEIELPKDLMEDWNTMEVCVDCKKFISDIIASGKHSLSLANKRARLKRKTQSFSMASEKGAEYRPSERTINEV